MYKHTAAPTPDNMSPQVTPSVTAPRLMQAFDAVFLSSYFAAEISAAGYGNYYCLPSTNLALPRSSSSAKF